VDWSQFRHFDDSIEHVARLTAAVDAQLTAASFQMAHKIIGNSSAAAGGQGSDWLQTAPGMLSSSKV
jgi:hypothetical protein